MTRCKHTNIVTTSYIDEVRGRRYLQYVYECPDCGHREMGGREWLANVGRGRKKAHVKDNGKRGPEVGR